MTACAPLSQACAHFLKCVAGHAGADDPESKGSIPYGAVVAWGWLEGSPYTANRGRPELGFTDGVFSGKHVVHGLTGYPGVAQYAAGVHPQCSPSAAPPGRAVGEAREGSAVGSEV